MNHVLTHEQVQDDSNFLSDSPIRDHYGAIMSTVDLVIERDSFDDRPLRSLKNLCIVGAVGEGLKWTVDTFLKFHMDIHRQLARIVTSGAVFERDEWSEDKLQQLLVRHEQIGHLMTLTPS